MPNPDVERILAAHALNGEGPQWSPRERRLYWVDMRAPALHRFDPQTGEDQSWPMPSWIGCYALTDRGVLAALRGGLFFFDPAEASLTFAAPPPYDVRRFCFNDGGCDRQGRFHVGPMYDPLDDATAQQGPSSLPVWQFDPRGAWRGVTRPVRISNGLAFSPDGRTLFHSDTPTKTIWRLDYDPATGEAENPRVFAQVDGGGDSGGPDGAAVDADGFYVCAVFADSCLLRFDPDGRLERRIALPCRYPTMPAFGGEDLKTVYVTSTSFPIAAEERGACPDDGALFALEAPCAGTPAAFFQFSPDGPST